VKSQLPKANGLANGVVAIVDGYVKEGLKKVGSWRTADVKPVEATGNNSEGMGKLVAVLTATR